MAHTQINLAPFDPKSLTPTEVRLIRILRTLSPNMRDSHLGIVEEVLQRQAEQGKLHWPQKGGLQLVVSRKE